MSDVLKNIADAVDNNSTRRGFSDLFADSKAALDKLQAGLGGLLPSMPGMPVAKFGDLAIGIDMHPTVTPPSPVMPVPHVGKYMTSWRTSWQASPPPCRPSPKGWREWRAAFSRGCTYGEGA